MRFAQTYLLLWLWVLPILAGVLYGFAKRKQKIRERFAQPHLLQEVGNFYPRQEFRKGTLIVLAIASSIVALARPQWGYQWQEVKRQGLDIILAIDVSKSMLTQDVKPNRLERTKLAAQDLIKKLKGDRIGLVAFAGDAFLVCPLTAEYNGFLLSLQDLDTESVPRGGTNLARAIDEAIKEYDQTPSKYKAVVIATDGESLEGDPLAAAKRAKEKGIKIYGVGIGTPAGELIQVKDIVGNNEFVKDENGNFVKSRLNENLLRQIALTTAGSYVRASGVEFGLDLIYERELAKFEKRDIESKMEKKYYERFQIPLALALLLLLLETVLSLWQKFPLPDVEA